MQLRFTRRSKKKGNMEKYFRSSAVDLDFHFHGKAEKADVLWTVKSLNLKCESEIFK